MSWLYENIARPFLFAQESETAHDRTLAGLALASRTPWVLRCLEAIYSAPSLPVEVAGLTFPNPIGLGAGMDKRAAAVPAWEALGFGFAELGGVTWHPQPGNPQPRMFRVPKDEALINRMGFNNPGARAMAETLRRWHAIGKWPKHPIGVNLGKSKITPNDDAVSDYSQSFRELWSLADFFVVNVSSPNTPNLRQLQDKAALGAILAALREINQSLAEESGVPVRPIFVKVAPDLTFEALDEIVELSEPYGLAGIVATNTTLARPSTGHMVSRLLYQETGGLSGGPLRRRSTEVIRHLYRQTCGRLPIIGVGGVSTVEDAWDKVVAGASLVQVYSGLVYRGPAMIRGLVEGLKHRVGAAKWSECVGSGG